MKSKSDLLQEYIDGALGEGAKTGIEENLKANRELARQYQELIKINDMLEEYIQPVSPSNNFTEKVMSKILANVSINWQGVLLFTGIIICLMTTYMFISSVDMFSLLSGIGEIKIPYIDVSFSSSSFSMNFEILSNALLFIGFILAMIFLDISVLRPLFRRRSY